MSHYGRNDKSPLPPSPISNIVLDGIPVVAKNGKKAKIYVDNVDLGHFHLKENVLVRHKGGLSWFVASLFLLADMAGGGIVAIPYAVANATFIGSLAIVCLFAVAATVSVQYINLAVLLGRAWLILLRRHPEYRTHCRKPYAEMGKRALGPWMMHFASGCVNFTQFGASVVFLLLSAKNISEFMWTAFEVNISSCVITMILALLLLPVTLLKSPQDFWPVIILGMCSTFIAVILLCWGMLRDSGCRGAQPEAAFDAQRIFEGLGAVLFSFGGHSTFPTIQHDMRRPADFDKSAYFGFGIIAVVNILVAVFAGLTYGDSVTSSVITSIQTVPLRQTINLMIAAHCLLTVTLIINPLNQEAEEIFNVPQSFSVRRVVIRSTIMGIITFTAETLPKFGNVMAVMGGSTVTLTSLIFPCIFYLFLAAEEKKTHEAPVGESIQKPPNDEFDMMDDLQPISVGEMLKRTRPLTLFVCIAVCVIATVAGAAATISAAYSMAGNQFSPPCYVSLFSSSPGQAIELTSLTCCGEFRNISLFDEQCPTS